ncbi:type IV secretion system protein [Flavobacteriaceae bacterium F89]|uniref:Type IV secretion system protein n=1 Tax=Cerina litoralis TaxID=2874477 RepID=A0AAE3JS46_9FLAO|nr:conjugal transfer protein [Cerina litoralis]MCG2462058.1 type IV secretion system protein [Cerina litoralis]
MGTTMKKAMVSAILILIMGTGARAQGIPVYDNTNFISFVKSLIESGKQTSNLMKTVKFMKQQKERIEKVSNVVKQLNAVKEINRNNQVLFKVVKNDLREILNSPFIRPNEITKISNSFNSIIDTAIEDLDFCEQLLSNGQLKMSDGERAQVLKGMELKSKEMVIEIEEKTKRYHDIISFRDMQEKINNQKSNY